MVTTSGTALTKHRCGIGFDTLSDTTFNKIGRPSLGRSSKHPHLAPGEYTGGEQRPICIASIAIENRQWSAGGLLSRYAAAIASELRPSRIAPTETGRTHSWCGRLVRGCRRVIAGERSSPPVYSPGAKWDAMTTQCGNGNCAHSSRTSSRTSSITASSPLALSTRSMNVPTRRMSSSFNPRVVAAGEPMRIPLV